MPSRKIGRGSAQVERQAAGRDLHVASQSIRHPPLRLAAAHDRKNFCRRKRSFEQPFHARIANDDALRRSRDHVFITTGEQQLFGQRLFAMHENCFSDQRFAVPTRLWKGWNLPAAIRIPSSQPSTVPFAAAPIRDSNARRHDRIEIARPGRNTGSLRPSGLVPAARRQAS